MRARCGNGEGVRVASYHVARRVPFPEGGEWDRTGVMFRITYSPNHARPWVIRWQPYALVRFAHSDHAVATLRALTNEDHTYPARDLDEARLRAEDHTLHLREQHSDDVVELVEIPGNKVSFRQDVFDVLERLRNETKEDTNEALAAEQRDRARDLVVRGETIAELLEELQALDSYPYESAIDEADL